MTAQTYFTESQLDLMTCVIDRIIRSDDRHPGAGELGIANYVNGTVGKSVQLRRLFARGLPQFEITARSAFSNEFANLSNEQRDDVLRHVESDDPEFFGQLVRQTYNGYYMNPQILEMCGLEARPPQPRGHRVELGNISLIENVKQRGKVYREVE